MKTKQKRCSICGSEKPLSEFHRRRHTSKTGYRSACKSCTRQVARLYQQKYRENHPVSEADRKKQRVRSKTHLAIEKGILVSKPCAVCGNTEVEAHHPSYDGPNAFLEVIWYCKTHHAMEHGTRAWTKQRELFPIPREIF